VSGLGNIALAGALLALAGCGDKQPSAPAPVRPVLSVVVEPILGRSVRFAGSIEPRYSSVLGFRILGRLIARKVNIGDVIAKGALLAALDPISLELAVRSAFAAVANAQAQLVNASATEMRQRHRDAPAHPLRAEQYRPGATRFRPPWLGDRAGRGQSGAGEFEQGPGAIGLRAIARRL
jgi:multidrug efflux pump subunit AcrA (membrane-fusion protein)